MANRYIPVTPEEAEEERKGGNIVYPLIGDNYNKLMKKIQPFKEAGYNVSDKTKASVLVRKLFYMFKRR